MTEQSCQCVGSDECFSSDKTINVEFAEDDKSFTKATISIPLINVGVNKKFVDWQPEVLKAIAPMFRGIVFKYDVNGSQGSSHVPEHLFSPFYDVGWTYDDERGAWFDGQTLWIRGDVTHPEVVGKLSRTGTDGKRELNAGSSGVFLNYKNVHCSICGKKPFGKCEHRRGQEYDGLICSIVPEIEAVEQALHVALTNDPADGEAIIHDLLLQDKNVKDIQIEKKGDEIMSDIEKKVEEAPKDEKKEEEKKVEEKKEVETAEAGMKKSVTCPSCGHKFSVEAAEMGRVDSVPAPVDKTDSIPTENTTPNRVSGANDDSTAKNRESLTKQGSLESQDSGIATKYVAMLNEKLVTECSRLKRKNLETADMDIKQMEFALNILKTSPTPKENSVSFESQDVSGYSAPSNKENKVELADMSASERAEKFGGNYGAMMEIFKTGKFN